MGVPLSGDALHQAPASCHQGTGMGSWRSVQPFMGHEPLTELPITVFMGRESLPGLPVNAFMGIIAMNTSSCPMNTLHVS
jgi:hypothetical protein